ncbi:MAG: carboxypeptidase-like regulatory domain-containing protein [Methanomassiliicoccales archaeon]|nr:carboxypeptidase-like regulatory domain-containing protein [Methanomassiliicoccales archaeon]
MHKFWTVAAVLLIILGTTLVAIAAGQASISPDSSTSTTRFGLATYADGTVKGVIKDADGRIMDQADVRLMNGTMTSAAMITSSDGAFSFTLTAGSYNLTVNKTGYQMYQRPVTLAQGQTLDLGTVTISRVPDYLWAVVVGAIVLGAAFLAVLMQRRQRLRR